MVSDSFIEIDGLKGYLAIPDERSGKGILMVHAWWGLNDFFKTLAHRFATEGFVAFAPDYYNGIVATTIDGAMNLRNKMDRKNTDAILKKALDYLKKHPSRAGEKIGVLGISLGTQFSVNLARNRSNDVGAIVLFYGLAGGKFDKFGIPLQGHFAENDEFEDTETVKKFEMLVTEGGGNGEFYTYPGTTHWFFEDDVASAYQKPAANLAFERTIVFLKSHL